MSVYMICKICSVNETDNPDEICLWNKNITMA